MVAGAAGAAGAAGDGSGGEPTHFFDGGRPDVAALSCDEDRGWLDFEVEFPDGSHAGCGHSTTTSVPWRTQLGSLLDVEQSESSLLLTLDSCAPDEACDEAQVTFLRLESNRALPKLEVTQGTFVALSIEVFAAPDSTRCRERLLLQNVEEWGGVANPTAVGELVWLAASDGFASWEVPGADITPTRSNCVDSALCNAQRSADIYHYEVAFRERTQRVEMGQTAAWSLGNRYWASFTNLRSFVERPGCDGENDVHWSWLLLQWQDLFNK